MDPLGFPAVFVPLIAAVFLVLRGTYKFGQRSSSGITSRSNKPSDEKQLLMAIRDADGSLTPVEASLETSLTVDEADEMLSRLAERGHLRVESREGALYYALPGRRGPENRTAPDS